MKISSRVDYALSCMLVVAAASRKKEVASVQYVAEAEHLATDYVEQLLHRMKRHGLLKSIRGMRGGYVLSRPPERISLYDIVESIEGDVLRLLCENGHARHARCVHLGVCRVKRTWVDLRAVMSAYLKRQTLAVLLPLRVAEHNVGH